MALLARCPREGQIGVKGRMDAVQNIACRHGIAQFADQIDACRGGAMWAELATRSLLREVPVSGATRLADGSMHYWLRLPLSSSGVEADLVLCHDRYLPAEAAVDPDRAAMWVDLSLRRDREFVPA
jgi:hypothetical protein